MTSASFKKGFLNKWPYFAVVLITLAFAFIIYAVNSIYPFGTGNIAGDDMVQQTIPSISYFWTCLHDSDSSLFFNWLTGGGQQSLSTFRYIFFPDILLVCLVCSQSAIVNALSFVLAFRFALCACTMCFFLRKRFTLGPMWQVTLSVIYALSAFALVYYTNIGWIYLAAIFPLTILAALHMFDTGKWWPYTLMLFYTLMCTLTSAYSIYFFLLLIGFLYLFFIQPKETRKMATVRFGVSSILGLVMSAWITIPHAYYTFMSERATEQALGESSLFDTFYSIYTATNLTLNVKVAMLVCGTGALWACVIMLVFTFKQHKRTVAFFLLSLLLLVLPAIFESLLLIWSMGSYVSFPMRYTYMLIFILVCAAAFVLQSGSLPEIFKGKLTFIPLVLTLAAGTGAAYVLVTKVYDYNASTNGIIYKYIFSDNALQWMLCVFFVLLAIYCLIVSTKNKTVSAALALGLALVELSVLGEVCIGTDSGETTGGPMYNKSFFIDSAAIAEDLDLDTENMLVRIKDMDLMLNSNYPMLINFPAMSNFTHAASDLVTDTMYALGYSQVYSRIYDISGTILSDMLLGVQYTFSEEELSDSEYTYLYDIGDTSLYAFNYTLPTGLIVSEDFVSYDLLADDDPFLSNNTLFNLLGGEGTLIETEEYTVDVSDDFFACTLTVEGEKHLYLFIDTNMGSDIANGSLKITVNGKVLQLDYFSSGVNYYYPNNAYYGMLDLGVFEDESVTVKIYPLSSSVTEITATFGFADYSLLEQVVELNSETYADVTTEKLSVTATYTATSDTENLFLPICYDKGWSATVNGEEVEIEYALGSFMAISLTEGENEIELTFFPYGMKLGIIISVLAFALFALLLILKKFKSIPNDKQNKLLSAFWCVYCVGMLVVYALTYVLGSATSIYYNYIW